MTARTTLRAALIVCLGLAVACSAGQPPAGSPRPATAPVPVNAVYPGAAWERVASPEAVGYRRAALDSVTQYLRGLPTTSAMVVVGGRSLYEYGDVREVSYLASARKSVLSMLYGKHVAAGTIRLDATLGELGIDDRQGLSDAEKRATVRHLLMTSSGVFHPASNPGDNLADAPPRGSQAPGAYFLYSNWDFNALGTIFEQRTGQSIYDAIQRDLAQPIGMQDYDRARHRRTGDSTRSVHLAYHMWFSTRDMARIGYVMLREGQWAGAQVLPADWVRESASSLVPSSRMNPPATRQGQLGYGYLWWTLEEPAGSVLAGAYAARGAFGQYIMVVPRLDMVIVHKRSTENVRNPTNVTWEQFMEFARRVAGARCGSAC